MKTNSTTSVRVPAEPAGCPEWNRATKQYEVIDAHGRIFAGATPAQCLEVAIAARRPM